MWAGEVNYQGGIALLRSCLYLLAFWMMLCSVVLAEEVPAPDGVQTAKVESPKPEVVDKKTSSKLLDDQESESRNGDNCYVLSSLTDIKYFDGAVRHDRFVANNPMFISRIVRFTIPDSAVFSVRDFMLVRKHIAQALTSTGYKIDAVSSETDMVETTQQRNKDDQDRPETWASGDGDDDAEAQVLGEAVKKPVVMLTPEKMLGQDAAELAAAKAEIRRNGVIVEFTINYTMDRSDRKHTPARTYGVVSGTLIRNSLGQKVVTFYITEFLGGAKRSLTLYN